MDSPNRDKTEIPTQFEMAVVSTDKSRIFADKVHNINGGERNTLKFRYQNLSHSSK